MNTKPIASTSFLDGNVREVLLGTEGRQYVIDDDGQRVYGVWVYIDEPEIIPCVELP